MKTVISDRGLDINSEEEFEEAENVFLKSQCAMMKKASTLVNSRNIHKVQAVLEEFPELMADESEGREYYQFKFQLLSPYKFAEDTDEVKM
jgi:hypothetical protein